MQLTVSTPVVAAWKPQRIHGNSGWQSYATVSDETHAESNTRSPTSRFMSANWPQIAVAYEKWVCTREASHDHICSLHAKQFFGRIDIMLSHALDPGESVAKLFRWVGIEADERHTNPTFRYVLDAFHEWALVRGCGR